MTFIESILELQQLQHCNNSKTFCTFANDHWLIAVVEAGLENVEKEIKKRMLDKINEALKMGWKVEIVK